MKDKTCCFTGHRDINKDINTLKARLSDVIESSILQGYRYFGAGGSRGFDTLAEETVLDLKEKYPHIHLI